jgi:hypothetical protein
MKPPPEFLDPKLPANETLMSAPATAITSTLTMMPFDSQRNRTNTYFLILVLFCFLFYLSNLLIGYWIDYIS